MISQFLITHKCVKHKHQFVIFFLLILSFRYMWFRAFTSANNFLSPSPNWSYKPINPSLPVSTTPPFNESELGSMDFNLWKEIGSTILVKNTVNNWLTCASLGGSLVDMVDGNIQCNVTKVIVPGTCEQVTPTTFQKDGNSAGLRSSSGIYYYFYTKGSGTWAISDPCGQSAHNQLTGVINPALWLYSRD